MSSNYLKRLAQNLIASSRGQGSICSNKAEKKSIEFLENLSVNPFILLLTSSQSNCLTYPANIQLILLNTINLYFKETIDMACRISEDQFSHQIPKIQMISKLSIKKSRQTENDLKIIKEWKGARSHFFAQYIGNMLDEAKAEESIKQRIIELFLLFQGIDLDWLEEKDLEDYRGLIKSLQQQLYKIQQHYQKKLRVCFPLMAIVQQKITSLQTINIEYQQKITENQNYSISAFDVNYSISAFDVFKIVFENSSIIDILIKGVDIENFQQFINKLNPQNSQVQADLQKRKKYGWIKQLKPLKTLKLAMNTRLQFKIMEKQSTLCILNDLIYFCRIFKYVSDMEAKLSLGNQSEGNDGVQIVDDLWRQLKKIKNIKITILNSYLAEQSLFRSAIFGGLASFTEISHLSLRKIRFRENVSISDFLAMEQIFTKLFENNNIKVLRLHECEHFPTFPMIETLEVVDVWSLTFWRQFNFMNQICLSNPNLSSIRCMWLQQQWRIGDNLFNKLQLLKVKYCNFVTLNNISPQSPSNIKYLSLHQSTLGDVDSMLRIIFPKLTNIKQLSLQDSQFDYQLISNIPSSHLEYLQSYLVNASTQKILKLIDNKWPYIRNIEIKKQSLYHETKEIQLQQFKWEFKELVKVKQDGLGDKTLKELRKKGITIS